ARRSRGRVPWRPIAVLAAAVVAGSALSLWTLRGGHHAPAASSAAPEAAPVPAASAPAAAAPAAAAPAPTFPAAAAPVLPVPGCAPSAPALVPDVVLSVDAEATEPTGGAARAADVRASRDDSPRKSRRKKSRKPKPAADEAPAEQADGAAATGEPPPVETIDASDEEPRKRARRIDL